MIRTGPDRDYEVNYTCRDYVLAWMALRGAQILVAEYSHGQENAMRRRSSLIRLPHKFWGSA